MGSSAFWAADAIMTNIEANNERRHANRVLANALRSHRGSIAQLAAALNAVREFAPDHPLSQQAVLDAIDHDGECTATFQQAWRLDHDPVAILAMLESEFEKKRVEALTLIEQMSIKTKRKGWFWSRRDVYYFAGVGHEDILSAIQKKLISLSWQGLQSLVTHWHYVIYWQVTIEGESKNALLRRAIRPYFHEIDLILLKSNAKTQ